MIQFLILGGSQNSLTETLNILEIFGVVSRSKMKHQNKNDFDLKNISTVKKKNKKYETS